MIKYKFPERKNTVNKNGVSLIVVTSPIPSHPDTNLIDEAIKSILNIKSDKNVSDIVSNGLLKSLQFKNIDHHKLFTDLEISKKNEFDLDNYQILEKHKNCYLIKNYD